MSHSSLLKATVGAKIRLTTWSDTTITRIRQRHANLDRGQTAFEYLGIILVVIVIIGAVVGSGVGSEITKRIKQAVTDIKAG
ncbi:hypothetical protein ACFWSF_12275 [Streptomyces sp. NPDC058611]|uniref:hypothetical protein n=1 Tax=unclassified Streptomyces TaxID=2593676 RepID=UPI003667754D